MDTKRKAALGAGLGAVIVGGALLLKKKEAPQECLIDSDCPAGYICFDGMCVPEDTTNLRYLEMTAENLLAIGDPYPGLRAVIESGSYYWAFGDRIVYNPDGPKAVTETLGEAYCIVYNEGGSAVSFTLALQELIQGQQPWRDIMGDYSHYASAYPSIPSPSSITMQPDEAKLLMILRYQWVDYPEFIRFRADFGYTDEIARPNIW